MNSPIKVVCTHAGLIKQLARREILERYKGSTLGLLWSFFNPLLMLLVYLFVFSFVFNMRWQGATGHTQFGTVMFSGLILHALLGECLSRAPGLILGNAQFVKKVVFPARSFFNCFGCHCNFSFLCQHGDSCFGAFVCFP